MSIDLTPEELARMVKLCEASDMLDNVNVSIRNKARQCLNNFGPTPELVDAREMAHKWKSPV